MLSKCSTTELCPLKKAAYYIMNIFRCLKMYIKLVKIQMQQTKNYSVYKFRS